MSLSLLPQDKPPNPRSQDEVDANAGTGCAECVGPGGGLDTSFRVPPFEGDSGEIVQGGSQLIFMYIFIVIFRKIN